MSRLALSLVFAIAVVGTFSGAVNYAYERGHRQGRAVGQCDIVVKLDEAMRRKDPTWGAPSRLVTKCAALIKRHPAKSETPSDV